MSTALEQTKPTQVEQFTAFGNISHFETAQRMAKALCSSSIVPQTYQGDNRIGDCMIALEIANRIGANVLAVMQNLYIVHGRPAWSSQFIISCINASGRFSPMRYRMTGTPGEDSYGCVAWAQDKTGEKLESPEITVGMAKAEGWYQKNGSKWKTMPELMLRYRAATLFGRLYAPELLMGIQTDEEVIDVEVVSTAPVVTEPLRPKFDEPPRLLPKPEADESKPKAKKPNPLHNMPPAAPAEPPSQPVPVAQAEPPPNPPQPQPAPIEPDPLADPEPTPATKLADAMKSAGVSEKQVLAFCKEKLPSNPATKLSEITDNNALKIAQHLSNPASQILKQIKAFEA